MSTLTDRHKLAAQRLINRYHDAVLDAAHAHDDLIDAEGDSKPDTTSLYRALEEAEAKVTKIEAQLMEALTS